MSNWTRLDSATAGTGVFLAVLFFPIFFKGFSGFWEDLTEFSARTKLSFGQCKVIWWLLLAAGGAYSARVNLPHWFPHFFQQSAGHIPPSLNS
jgi:hypothetical protein